MYFCKLAALVLNIKSCFLLHNEIGGVFIFVLKVYCREVELFLFNRIFCNFFISFAVVLFGAKVQADLTLIVPADGDYNSAHVTLRYDDGDEKLSYKVPFSKFETETRGESKIRKATAKTESFDFFSALSLCKLWRVYLGKLWKTRESAPLG